MKPLFLEELIDNAAEHPSLKAEILMFSFGQCAQRIVSRHASASSHRKCACSSYYPYALLAEASAVTVQDATFAVLPDASTCELTVVTNSTRLALVEARYR